MRKLLLSISLLALTQIYAQDGILDTTFGNGGKVLTSVNGVAEKAYGLALQSDGKIVVAGYTYSQISGNDFACIRYNADGSLDTAFGTGGKATFDLQLGSDDKAYSIDIELSTGKIVLGGYSDNGSNKDGAVIRLNTNGTIDTTFGVNGLAVTNFSTSGAPNRQDEYKVIKIHQLTGNIVAGGSSFKTNNDATVIFARYTSAGVLDATFNTSGKVTGLPIPISGWTFLFTIEDLAIKSNGKITAVGWIKPTTGTLYDDADHYECRLNANGTLDTTFSEDGYDTDLFATSDNKTNAIILNPNDTFDFGGGHPWNNNKTRIYVGTTNASGTSTNDSTLEFWDNSQPYCYALAKDNSGKFVTGGTIIDYTTGNSSFLVCRLMPDLSIDTSFGLGGYAVTFFDDPLNEAYDMKIQSDGKIVLAGFSGNKIALARFGTGTLSNDNITVSNNTKIYPNPASGFLNIVAGKNYSGDLSFTIIDMNGRTIMVGKLSESGNTNVNIESLQSGLYLLNAGGTTNIKFIKK